MRFLVVFKILRLRYKYIHSLLIKYQLFLINIYKELDLDNIKGKCLALKDIGFTWRFCTRQSPWLVNC